MLPVSVVSLSTSKFQPSLIPPTFNFSVGVFVPIPALPSSPTTKPSYKESPGLDILNVPCDIVTFATNRITFLY